MSFIVYVLAFQNEREYTASLFFASALATAHTKESVRTDNIDYLVYDGVIEPDVSDTTSHRTFEILRIAYALTSARRDPLWGLEDVDLKQLENSITSLEKAQNKLGQTSQTNEDRIALVICIRCVFCTSCRPRTCVSGVFIRAKCATTRRI